MRIPELVGWQACCKYIRTLDKLGFEPRAFRMRSGCDATTPCARLAMKRRGSNRGNVARAPAATSGEGGGWVRGCGEGWCGGGALKTSQAPWHNEQLGPARESCGTPAQRSPSTFVGVCGGATEGDRPTRRAGLTTPWGSAAQVGSSRRCVWREGCPIVCGTTGNGGGGGSSCARANFAGRRVLTGV